MTSIKKKVAHYFANKFAESSMKFLEEEKQRDIEKLQLLHSMEIESLKKDLQIKVQTIKKSSKLYIVRFQKESEKVKETYKVKEKELERTRAKFDAAIDKILNLHKGLETWLIDSGPLISSSVEMIRKFSEASNLCSKIQKEVDDLYHSLFEHEFVKDTKHRMIADRSRK